MIGAIVLVAVVGALTLKPSAEQGPVALSEIPFDPSAPIPLEPVPESYDASEPGLPRLVALGAGTCIPCRAMAPIRAELRRDYAGRLEVDFYDVWKDKEAGWHFGVRVIPTLIYYDAAGRELGRQQGYLPKETILASINRYRMSVGRAGG
ncbi:MAG: thioredoxin family protein [Gemmatimonadota bacterium]